MLQELDRAHQHMTELEILRQEVAELQGIKQRCQKAEAAVRELKKRNQLLADSTPLGIFTVDTQGNITGITRKMLEMLSWPHGDNPRPKSLSDAKVPSDIFSDIQRCIDHKKPIIVEYPYSNPGTCSRWRYYLSPIHGDNDIAEELMVIVEDYTDLNITEKALRESGMRYRQLFQSSPVALIERDASQLKSYLEQLRKSGISDFRTYLEKNPAQVHYCWSLIKSGNYNAAYLELMDIADIADTDGEFFPTDSKSFLEMALEIILVVAEGRNANERELPVVTSTGESKFVLGKSLVASGHEETMKQVVVALVDISQRKQSEKALRESEQRFRDQAYRDNLTGLFNQRYLYKSLAELIDSAQTTMTQLSLIFIDLDHFKKIVDRHGHLNGSRAICNVAHTIKDCLEKPSYAVAYAGDEFVVVLPGMDQEQAGQKASEIRSRIKETVYELEQGVEVRLQASFGIATWPQHAREVNDLLAAADQALFTIKEAGKDSIGQFQSLEQ